MVDIITKKKNQDLFPFLCLVSKSRILLPSTVYPWYRIAWLGLLSNVVSSHFCFISTVENLVLFVEFEAISLGHGPASEDDLDDICLEDRRSFVNDLSSWE
jgi:hypothetical protein